MNELPDVRRERPKSDYVVGPGIIAAGMVGMWVIVHASIAWPATAEIAPMASVTLFLGLVRLARRP